MKKQNQESTKIFYDQIKNAQQLINQNRKDDEDEDKEGEKLESK